MKGFSRAGFKGRGALFALALAYLALAAAAAFGNIYEELGLDRNTPAEDIRWSYKRMAAAFHPDRYPEGSKDQKNAEDIFKEKKEMYDILLDPELRKKYDEWLDSGGYEEHLRQQEEEAELNRWRKEKEERRQREEEEERERQRQAEEKKRERQRRAEEKRQAEMRGGSYLHRALLAYHVSSNDYPLKEMFTEKYYSSTLGRYKSRLREITRALSIILKNQSDIDINAQNSLGKTALHLAAGKKYGPAARLLIKAGADPNIRDSHGLLPVHHVILSQTGARRKADLTWLAIPFFLKSGAVDFSLRTPDGKTAVELALERGYQHTAKAILRLRGAGYLRQDEKMRLSNMFIDLKDAEGFALVQRPNSSFANQAYLETARVIDSLKSKPAAFGVLAGLSFYIMGDFSYDIFNLYQLDKVSYSEIIEFFGKLPLIPAAGWLGAWSCRQAFKLAPSRPQKRR